MTSLGVVEKELAGSVFAVDSLLAPSHPLLIFRVLDDFGDERAVANTMRMSGLDIPVLIQAFPDEPNKMSVADRRDSFCGKMSVCNNLKQYGILRYRDEETPEDDPRNRFRGKRR